MEEWEQLWAEERDAIVARAKAEGYGKSADGKTLTGPGGFTLDLSQCLAGWSDTEGVSDTAIRIGSTNFFSGAAADYGNLTLAQDVLFKHYSDQGAFADSTGKTRKIDFVYKDDGYEVTRSTVNGEPVGSPIARSPIRQGGPETFNNPVDELDEDGKAVRAQYGNHGTRRVIAGARSVPRTASGKPMSSAAMVM